MKSLLFLCSIGALLTSTYNSKNAFLTAKTPLKANKITSFDQFIYNLDEKKSYYGDIKNLKGEDLILKLEEIISKNNVKPDYSGKTKMVSGGTSLWSTYFLLDRDFDKSPMTDTEANALNNNSKNMWWGIKDLWMDILYEKEPYQIIGTKPNTTSSSKIDREHVYPKSWGFNDPNDTSYYEDIMAGCDMHNLHMGEHNANVGHKNYPFYEFEGSNNIKSKLNPNDYNTKNGKLGSVNIFEPQDIEKGDIARSIFYMATRYHTYNSSEKGLNIDGKIVDIGEKPALKLGNNLYNTSTKSPKDTLSENVTYGSLDCFLKWNENDKVSSHEQIRNSLCQSFVQGNRNPFIDFPLWADVCFNPETQYVANINKPNGVSIAEDIILENPDILWDKYPMKSKIDLSKISVSYVEEDVSTNVVGKDLSFILKNKDTNKESTYTSTDIINLLTPGNYSLTIKHTPSDLVIVKDFIVEDYVFAKFVGEIPSFYEGDTLTLSKYKLVDDNDVEFNTSDLTFKLFNKDTNTEETLSDDKVLDEGDYYLSIYATKDQLEYKGSSEHFIVKPLSESLNSSFDINKANVGDKIDLSSLTFSYIRNQQVINVPKEDLTILLVNTSNNKQIDLSKETTYTTSGNYSLTVSYKADDKYSLAKSYIIEVNEIPFWETKGFKIGVIAAGATLGAIVLIVIIILIVKKH